MEDQNQNQKNNSKNIVLSVLAIVILLVIVVAVSYAAFTYSRTGQVTNTITTGSVSMHYTEAQNGITIMDAVPMTEAQGKALSGTYTYTDEPASGEASGETHTYNRTFEFSVDATIKGRTTVNYEIAVEKDITRTNASNETSDGLMTQEMITYCQNNVWGVANPTDEAITNCTLIKDSDIRLWLVKKTSSGISSVPNASGELPNGVSTITGYENPSAFVPAAGQYGASANEMVIGTGSFTNNTDNTYTDTHYYELKMWVNSSYAIDGVSRTYAVRVNVYAA